MNQLQISSPAFANKQSIPQRFTCEGENISPPLTIAGVPSEAESLALIVTDPDIPSAVKNKMGIEVFDHWIAYNIPADTTEIPARQAVGIQGVNSSGDAGYTGPCPPAAHEPTEHRYIFTVLALDTELDLPDAVNRERLLTAAENHILAKAKLIGRYEKEAA